MELVNSSLKSQETVVTFILEPQASGSFVASIMEFPDCRAEAETREGAIALAQQQLQEYLKQFEVFRVVVSTESKPGDAWDRMFGLFKDDPDFAEIAVEIRAAREVDDDSEVDPAIYES